MNKFFKKNSHIIKNYIEINYGIYLYLRLLKRYDFSCYCKYLQNCYSENNNHNLKWCILNNKNNKSVIYSPIIINKLMYIPLYSFYNILNYGFSWDESSEGFYYWSDKNDLLYQKIKMIFNSKFLKN